MCVCTWPWDWCTHYKGQRCEENSWTGNSDSWPDQIRHILCSSHHIKYHLPVERSLFLISLSGHRRVGPIGQDVGSGFIYFLGGYKNKRINNAEHQRWEELGRVPGWHLHCVVLRKPLKLSVVKMKETAAAADSWRAFPSDLRCMHAPLSSSYATPSCFSVKQVYICRWTYF